MVRKTKLEKELLKNYQKGVSAIEDLQMLSDYKVTPLIHNIYHYFSEMNRAAQYLTEDKNGFIDIKTQLEENFKNTICNFLLEQKNINQINFHNNLHVGSLDNWDRFAGIFPLGLSVIKILPFKNFMEFELNPDTLKIKGDISEDFNPETLRKKIYAITRKIFEKKALMTFNLLCSKIKKRTH